jgi:hypothetical protein
LVVFALADGFARQIIKTIDHNLIRLLDSRAEGVPITDEF